MVTLRIIYGIIINYHEYTIDTKTIQTLKGDGDMILYEKITAGEEKIALVGLGYVGMPIAVAFARKVKVIGFDLNEDKIKKYR